jgi:hypothetical protein
MSINPYSSPALLAQPEMAAAQPPAAPLRALLRWTLVCGVSAAPSFFWGCALDRGIQHIAAMISGIVVFILAYTAFECTRTYRRLMQVPYMRRTAMIGYGTRVVMSIVFPVGLAVDMLVGMGTMTIVGAVAGALPSANVGGPTFLVVFILTLVQGTLMNLLLVGYMGAVFWIQWLAGERSGTHEPSLVRGESAE